MMDSRITRHDEGGKDYNAEAMIIETRNKSGSISATPGWKMKQLRRNLIELSGPGVSICKPRYNIVIWRAENRTHLSKQTRTSTEHSRKASNVRGIPSRPDDQLRWVLIVRTQV